MRAWAVGDDCRVPNRSLGAWGRIIAIEGAFARVEVRGSRAIRSRIEWCRLTDLHTAYSWRKAKKAGLV